MKSRVVGHDRGVTLAELVVVLGLVAVLLSGVVALGRRVRLYLAASEAASRVRVESLIQEGSL